jgi:hypothetical protein
MEYYIERRKEGDCSQTIPAYRAGMKLGPQAEMFCGPFGLYGLTSRRLNERYFGWCGVDRAGNCKD